MNLPATRIPRGIPAGTSRLWSAKRNPLDEAIAAAPNRRYEIQWLDDGGLCSSLTRAAPAVTIFEEAFSALARGALIDTQDGRMAVEDLIPGTMVMTETGLEELVWIGSITILPDPLGSRPTSQRLYRITADAFGIDRPMPDLVLGPSARVLSRSASVQSYTGGGAALAPITSMVDGASIIEVTPVSPVRVFHLGFRGHRVLRVNGVEVESFHPGHMSLGRLGPEMTSLFLSFFPHVRDLSGFGRLSVPRVSEEELEQMYAP